MKRVSYLKWVVLLAFSYFYSHNCIASEIISPEEFLGFKPGEAFHLADYHTIIQYFDMVAQSSDRIKLNMLGETTMGHPFYLATISAADNLMLLNKYKLIQDKLSDPRTIDKKKAEDLIDQGKTIVVINCCIHPNEIGPSQMSLNLLYKLATDSSASIQSILNNVILFLLPVQNPDGQIMVVDWYKKYLGTPYEGCPMPWLYHKYIGHDINRDWFMLTQVETRLTVEEIYRVWHPQVVLDMHQMGRYSARQFIPPYIKPIDPNIDPIILDQAHDLGQTILNRFTSLDKPGVVISALYNAWSPSRAYPFYHGGVRFLSETASCRIATPIIIEKQQLRASNGFEPEVASIHHPLPWQGACWDLAQIVEYSEIVALTLLEHAAMHRRKWLKQFFQINLNAINPNQKPFAYLILDDSSSYTAVRRMLTILQTGEVEIHRSIEDFSVDSRRYPAGTFLIFTAQPFGAFAKTLIGKYPNLYQSTGGASKRNYEITTHHLPLLFGVRVIEIETPFQVKCKLIQEISHPSNDLPASNHSIAYSIASQNMGYKIVNQMMQNQIPIYWTTEDCMGNQIQIQKGTFLIPSKKLNADARLLLRNLAGNSWIQISVIEEPFKIKAYLIKKPRIGLYQSWVASMDEGWTRWIFEQYHFEYITLHDKDVQNGCLNEQFDVIILPDQSARAILHGHPHNRMPPEFCGGIAERGVEQLKLFVNNGGILITLDSASELILHYFDAGLKNVASEWSRRQFYIPGSMLRVKLDVTHPVCFGYQNETAILFLNSPVFKTSNGRIIGSYDLCPVCLNGIAYGIEKLSGMGAMVELKRGLGRIICFGFRPQFRAQTENTFRFLFNSIYYSALEKENLLSFN